MTLLNRIIKKLMKAYLDLKFVWLKIILGDKFKSGKDINIKNTTRIEVYDKKGELIINDGFSIGYNSELYVWNNRMVIGTNTSINDNCKIYGNVTIGSNCLFASNIYMSSGSHTFLSNKHLPIKAQDRLGTVDKPILIEDDCWFGFGVVIMAGVYIGKGAIIGSNSVVTKDIYPYTINAGVPSKVIGKRIDFKDSFNEINCFNEEHYPYFYRGINYKQFEDHNSIKDGLEVINKTAVFLLSKSVLTKIKLSGFSNKIINFEIALNNSSYIKRTTSKGYFEIIVDTSEISKLDDFVKIPKKIKDEFNIVIIKTASKSKQNNLKENNWKIRSVGLYDN